MRTGSCALLRRLGRCGGQAPHQADGLAAAADEAGPVLQTDGAGDLLVLTGLNRDCLQDAGGGQPATSAVQLVLDGGKNLTAGAYEIAQQLEFFAVNYHRVQILAQSVAFTQEFLKTRLGIK